MPRELLPTVVALVAAAAPRRVDPRERHRRQSPQRQAPRSQVRSCVAHHERSPRETRSYPTVWWRSRRRPRVLDQVGPLDC